MFSQNIDLFRNVHTPKAGDIPQKSRFCHTIGGVNPENGSIWSYLSAICEKLPKSLESSVFLAFFGRLLPSDVAKGGCEPASI
jgi:hypothetical protein